MTMSNLLFFRSTAWLLRGTSCWPSGGSEPGTQDAMCATKISQVLTEISNSCPEVGI